MVFLGMSVGADVLLAVLWVILLPLPLQVLGPAVAAAVLLGSLFLPSYRIGSVVGSPNEVLAYLAHRLRAGGHRVEQSHGLLTVRIGRTSALRLRLRALADRDGCAVRFQPYATSSGWGTILFLILVTLAAVVAIPLIVYVVLRARTFALREVEPILREPITPPQPSSPEEAAAALVDGLSEAHRLAAEAAEAERSAYHDGAAVVVLASLGLWLIVLFAFFLLAPGFGPASVPGYAALTATVIVTPLAALSIWALRRRANPRLERYREWANRLRDTLQREASRRIPEPAEPSSFEILAGASAEVPRWLEATRRAGLDTDPAIGFLVMMVALWTVGLLSAALTLARIDATVSLLFVATGAALAVGAALLFRRWRLRRDEEMARTQSEWNRRLTWARAEMERYLRDL